MLATLANLLKPRTPNPDTLRKCHQCGCSFAGTRWRRGRYFFHSEPCLEEFDDYITGW